MNSEDNLGVSLINEELENDSGAEETISQSTGKKSYRDLYVNVVTNPNNLTLTDDYTFNPEIDQSLFVIGIPDFYENYVIDGQGHTIDGANSARFFMVSGTNVTLKNINFINGNSSLGGTVHFSKSGTIDNCTFSNNYANLSDVVSFDDCGYLFNSEFNNNSAYNGTTVFLYGGVIDNCYFLENKGTRGGAVRFNSKGNLSNSIFVHNYAERGGAIFNTINGISIDNCRFESNSAKRGGAIFSDADHIFINNSDFFQNNADNGGAVELNDGTIINSNFNLNDAGISGGAVYSNYYVLIDGCTFEDQFAGDGGVLYCLNSGLVQNSLFEHNIAFNNGGSIFFTSFGEVYSNNFTDNKAMFELGNSIYCNNKLFSKLSKSNTYSSQNSIYCNNKLFAKNNFYDNETNAIFSNRTYDFKAVHVDGNAAASGDGSFRHPWESLLLAIENCNADEAVFMHSGTYSGPAYSSLNIEKYVNIFADGEVVIDGNHTTIFYIHKGANIEGITFKNAYTEVYGGALWVMSDAETVLNNCKFIDNQARFNGGAIFCEGYLEVNDCFFSNNRQSMQDPGGADSSTWGGGAITGTYPLSMLFIKNTVFENNYAAENGGAIQAGALAYIDNTFDKNHKDFECTTGRSISLH